MVDPSIFDKSISVPISPNKRGSNMAHNISITYSTGFCKNYHVFILYKCYIFT